MISRYQFCHLHRVIEETPVCDNGHGTGVASTGAALHPKDRPVVFENPQTGEVRYPARQDSPMMPGYEERGFKRREFTSYHEHKKWCDKNGVMNHGLEGVN